jgi:glycosyltransferase involved in cell wall biosynthesis
MIKVLVIQQVMKQYRLPFFLRLHDNLSKQGIGLTVAYSDPNDAHSLRKDNVELPDSFGLKVKGYWFFNRLLYQPLWKQIAQADLVIVGPEIKYLINPVLLLMSALGLKKVAFWGLGPNLHPDCSPAAEWVKKFIFTKVDWWFAYTATIADYLKKRGMPVSRITTVQNATDTSEQRRFILEIQDEDVAGEKLALTGSRDSRIGLYCGMMQRIKSLPFLIETARQVKKKCSAFHLILLGDGPERPWLEREIAGESWIHFLGPKFGQDTALYFKMADVFLFGGTAGLAVVDSFAAGLPVLATQLPTHPPEISYIRDGENGRIAPHEATAFAESIVETISDSAMLSRMRAGAWESGGHYTLETMVDNFSNGIKSCLVASGITSFMDASRWTAQPIDH